MDPRTYARSRDAAPPAARTALIAASLALAGVVLSGPVGLALVRLRPQPAWTDAETFARAYHPLQTLPYFLGFLLVGGSLALIAALQALANDDDRPRATVALGFASTFAALITLNYVLQTTFVPALASDYRPQDGPLLSALTLSNPRALGWALEMWGYAVLGVATWLAAPVLRRLGAAGRGAATLFVANGPVSLAGGVWTALAPGWVMTPAGLAMFAAWNLLVIVMFALAIAALRGPSPRLARLAEAP
jgi:hypothetical protein